MLPLPLVCAVVAALLSHGAGPQSKLGGGAQQKKTVLNEQHRIFTVDHFLSEAEIEHVLRVARERITAEHDGDESWQYWKRYAFTEMDDWQGDAVLRSIEERIAQLVNIRTHGDESPLIVSQTLPQKAKDRPRRGKRQLGSRELARKRADPFKGGRLMNVHHDKNTAEGRVISVLVYLTDVAAGGHTIFPAHAAAARTTDTAVAAAAAREVGSAVSDARSAFEAAFRGPQRERILWPTTERDCFNRSLFRAVTRGCASAAAAAAGTSAAAAATDGPLVVAPRRGQALVFASAWPNGSSDPTMWHGGCIPVAPSQPKWTIQKFKEFPPTGDIAPADTPPRQATTTGAAHQPRQEDSRDAEDVARTEHDPARGRSALPAAVADVAGWGGWGGTVGRGCGGAAAELRCERALLRWAREGGAYLSGAHERSSWPPPPRGPVIVNHLTPRGPAGGGEDNAAQAGPSATAGHSAGGQENDHEEGEGAEGATVSETAGALAGLGVGWGGGHRGLRVHASARGATLHVPRPLQLSYAAACNSDFGVQLRLCHHQQLGNDGGGGGGGASSAASWPPAPSVVLALFLLHERAKGAAGAWWPYIAALPAHHPTVGLEYRDVELALLDQVRVVSVHGPCPDRRGTLRAAAACRGRVVGRQG
jgi:hypothetical protein